MTKNPASRTTWHYLNKDNQGTLYMLIQFNRSLYLPHIITVYGREDEMLLEVKRLMRDNDTKMLLLRRIDEDVKR